MFEKIGIENVNEKQLQNVYPGYREKGTDEGKITEDANTTG